ncbi:MAG TPA: TraR/DksA C4-type zinc finger protein [Alphaproteobacteria bacterium]|jgi:DnaK suppressor protein|nr:TraR/DksA C4-type zinc finger protein [Alphaproteobacteria bacterium]
MAARGRLGIDLRNYRRRLVAFRDELERLWAAPSSSPDSAPDFLAETTPAAPLDILQVEAMAIEADRRRNAELRQIEDALQRMADGRYGYCVTCGENIAPDRLEGDPTAVLCADCARLAGAPIPTGK